MSGFAPSGQAATSFDPRKRVNYQQGMVLGSDEFMQDQYHHRSRDHHATRALHGYGTVSGLAVSVDEASMEVRVAPGLAVDPAGHLICVPVEYCADLAAWVNGRFDPDDVSAASVPSSLQIVVALCWTECETDDVPIPADSCLTAEDSRAPSRIMDSFLLTLSTDPPPIVGEIAPGSVDDLAALVEEIHGLTDPSGGPEPDPAAIAELLRQWAVERRPEIADGNACLSAVDNTCVLLGVVEVDVGDAPGGGLVVANPTVDDRDRPILATTRLLQEVLFAVGNDHEHSLESLTDVAVEGAAAGSVLGFDGSLWVPAAPAGGVSDHGALTGLADDDHAQYLLANGDRPLSGNLSAGGNRLTDLADSAANGQAITHGRAAGGDLTERYPNPRIGALQGVPLDARSPTPADVLVLRGRAWTATRPTLLPFATVVQTEQRIWRVWFNIDAPANQVAVEDFADALDVRRETDSPNLAPVAIEDIVQHGRNIFEVTTPQPQRPIRFIFGLDGVRLDNGQSALEWANEQGIWFCGQAFGDDRPTVTIFVADSLRTARVG